MSEFEKGVLYAMIGIAAFLLGTYVILPVGKDIAAQIAHNQKVHTDFAVRCRQLDGRIVNLAKAGEVSTVCVGRDGRWLTWLS